MIDERQAGFLRRSPLYELTDDEIQHLKAEIKAIDADETAFRFNRGDSTSYSDKYRTIRVRSDVFPDVGATIPRARMSERAVLAHEYYGHYLFAPSKIERGDWRDEMRASYIAAVKAPGLTQEDRSNLIQDAYDRVREAGVNVRYSRKAVELVYGITQN